jgi:hypothetical protein
VLNCRGATVFRQRFTSGENRHLALFQMNTGETAAILYRYSSVSRKEGEKNVNGRILH